MKSDLENIPPDGDIKAEVSKIIAKNIISLTKVNVQKVNMDNGLDDFLSDFKSLNENQKEKMKVYLGLEIGVNPHTEQFKSSNLDSLTEFIRRVGDNEDYGKDTVDYKALIYNSDSLNRKHRAIELGIFGGSHTETELDPTSLRVYNTELSVEYAGNDTAKEKAILDWHVSKFIEKFKNFSQKYKEGSYSQDTLRGIFNTFGWQVKTKKLGMNEALATILLGVYNGEKLAERQLKNFIATETGVIDALQSYVPEPIDREEIAKFKNLNGEHARTSANNAVSFNRKTAAQI